VPVGANIGVLVIIALVGIALGAWHFPTAYPDLPVWSYATAGAAAALLLVLSILLHELAHAVVAQANGIKVDQIVLWLFGGVAQLRGDPRTPGVDLAVAVVGPATSVLLGGLFGAATIAWLAVVGEGLGAATLAYLAVLNLLLAVFNLVPAAPLDGGRVLRALLWWSTGDRSRAAIVATRAGRYFGIALIVFGLGGALLWAWFGGLWLALIGWFLVSAALAEERSVTLGQQLRGVRVRDVMSRDPVTAPPDVDISSFVDEVVLHQRFSTYPLVGEDGRLTGLVTLDRIRQVPREQRSTTRLREIACEPGEVPTAGPDEPVTDLLPRMAGGTDGRAVAVDDQGRVVGLVTSRDIARMTAVSDLHGTGPDWEPYPPLAQGDQLGQRPRWPS
jgi:Zn-dependent protease/CBS domain-containing protein